MNFFGGNSEPEQNTQQMKMAKAEIKMYSDLFNKMCATCFEKCVYKYHEADLNLGEMSCVDRCIGKYLESHQKVGEVLKKFEDQAKAQMAAGQTPTPT